MRRHCLDLVANGLVGQSRLDLVAIDNDQLNAPEIVSVLCGVLREARCPSVEINGGAFARGNFVWNSEVGKRSISTFWFQAVCQNHIVWDAIDVTEVARRHVGDVGEALTEIRTIIEALVQKRNERKDTLASVIRKAMETTSAQDAEEVVNRLTDAGFTGLIATAAMDLAREKGKFSIWSVVDALTQQSRVFRYAGERTSLDQKASALLSAAT